MKIKKGQELELKINNIAFGGKGIGEKNGFKIFVPDACPGDLLNIKIGKVKKNYAEGRCLNVLKASPLRIEPRCKHFDVCGGCKFQFLSYQKQLEIKEQHVRDALERLAGLPDIRVQEILPCNSEWFYRNKMELSFGPSKNGGVMLGFYPPGYHYEVFDLEECYLQSADMSELVSNVRNWANKFKLTHYDSKKNPKGLLRNLTVREGKNTGEKMIILTTSTEEMDHESFIQLFQAHVSVYRCIVEQEKGHRTSFHIKHLSGPKLLVENLKLENGKTLSFDILPRAFFQTNTQQAQILYSKVLEYADFKGDELLFDLYCGTGTIGLFCSHAVKQVYGLEINPSSIENAQNNAIKNDIQNVEFICGRVEDTLKSLKERPDVIIVDPPRSGLGSKTVDLVYEFQAERIIYISCNPTSLARDLKQFASLGYKTECVLPIDMFPHTAHIECLCRLVKDF